MDSIKIIIFLFTFCLLWKIEGIVFFPPQREIPNSSYKNKTVLEPSHLLIGPGLFDVDRTRPKGMEQIEYRWEVDCYHLRPLVAFFMAADTNLFFCGGLGYDLFLGKKLVFTPSFAPGLYYHGHGKNLGFPLNFRSAIELSYVFENKGRIGAQFSHISNAHMLYKNPGANSLFIFYAIPFTRKKKN